LIVLEIFQVTQFELDHLKSENPDGVSSSSRL